MNIESIDRNLSFEKTELEITPSTTLTLDKDKEELALSRNDNPKEIFSKSLSFHLGRRHCEITVSSFSSPTDDRIPSNILPEFTSSKPIESSATEAFHLISQMFLKPFNDKFQNPILRSLIQRTSDNASKASASDEPLDPILQLFVNALNRGSTQRILLSSPLQTLQKDVKEQAVLLEDAEGKQYNFGTHYHGYGKSLVKGGNLCFREIALDGNETIELDFKINHAFREQLQKVISQYSDKEISAHMEFMLNLTGSLIKKITVIEGVFELGGFQIQKAYHLEFEGIGSILVGSDPEAVGMYNRVFVHIPKECTLFQLYEMLSFVHLEDAIQLFTPDDLKRLKIGYLFRHFFPRQATPFERTSQFFKLPIPQLKMAIIEQAPSMNEIFEKYMPQFKTYETLPGRIRYGIEGVGKRCYDLGARSLISSIRINPSSGKQALDKVVSILKMGMLSSELKYGSKFISKGLSPDSDLRAGSTDSVFAQLVTAYDYQNNNTPSLEKFSYFYSADCIALEFDLDVLDTLTYQYHYDSYGTRKVFQGKLSTYLRRPKIYDFVTKEEKRHNLYSSNEVMVKDRIPPSFIKGILIANNDLRENLYQHLKETKLIQTNQDGIETIFDTPVDQFIRIPSNAKKSLEFSTTSDFDIIPKIVELPTFSI